MAKVIYERGKCIGCGSCAAVCPKFWEMADDGKSRFKGPKEITDHADIECNKEAAEGCPAECIHVEE